MCELVEGAMQSIFHRAALRMRAHVLLCNRCAAVNRGWTNSHFRVGASRIEVQLQKTLPGLLKSCACGRVERQPSVFLFGGLPWQLGHRGRGLIVPGMNPWESPKAPFNPGCSGSVRSTLALYLSIAPSYAVNGCSLTFMAR